MVFPEINFLAVIVAALVPNIIGAIYYGPLFGKVWRNSMSKTEEDMKHKNEAVVYGSALLCSAIIAFFLKITTELVHKDVNDSGELILASHHTFGHGVLHAAMIAITFIIPVIVCLGLFHKSTFKNILINSFFWLVCFAIMGGILDAWN